MSSNEDLKFWQIRRAPSRFGRPIERKGASTAAWRVSGCRAVFLDGVGYMQLPWRITVHSAAAGRISTAYHTPTMSSAAAASAVALSTR